MGPPGYENRTRKPPASRSPILRAPTAPATGNPARGDVCRAPPRNCSWVRNPRAARRSKLLLQRARTRDGLAVGEESGDIDRVVLPGAIAELAHHLNPAALGEELAHLDG